MLSKIFCVFKLHCLAYFLKPTMPCCLLVICNRCVKSGFFYLVGFFSRPRRDKKSKRHSSQKGYVLTVLFNLYWLKFDLVMCYKIVFGLVKLEFSEFFVTAPVTITHGHPYRLFVNLARHNVRKDFFANRVVKYWNYLPADFDFSSIICFKRNLNKIDFTDFLIIQ